MLAISCVFLKGKNNVICRKLDKVQRCWPLFEKIEFRPGGECKNRNHSHIYERLFCRESLHKMLIWTKHFFHKKPIWVLKKTQNLTMILNSLNNLRKRIDKIFLPNWKRGKYLVFHYKIMYKTVFAWLRAWLAAMHKEYIFALLVRSTHVTVCKGYTTLNQPTDKTKNQMQSILPLHSFLFFLGS